ncbi:TRAP transporter large permease [Vibrio aestuarianus]|uniref:TRAP transporter large permease n=1 Tax=Vibrio aestuarianus TaxID=28171 RepID=UPI0006A5BD36|nr:TRAP transporter large permease [Vibrio aestuarianus]KOE81901.1 membrane protein [Vibrio alginolyticus]MDE1323765.1 TRAP transporter large permease [Vibrio aestuarianus]
MDITQLAVFLLLSVFAVLLVSGVPIGITMVLAALVSIMPFIPLESSIFIATQKMFAGLDSFALIALPFFIFAGNMMNRSGVADKLINFSKLLVGFIPGGLALTNIMGNMVFGAISGSAIASATAMGTTLTNAQRKEGYDPAFAAATNIASAPTGMLIPPSGLFIILSLVSGTSISSLFMAGYLPGFLMGLACMTVAVCYAKKNGYPITQFPDLKDAVRITLEAIPVLCLVIIVMGGILSGVFTATEASGVASLYAILLGIAYRNTSFKDFWMVVIDTIRGSVPVLFMISASGIMSWSFAFTGIPDLMKDFLGGIPNPLLVMLVINIMLLVIGTFMDATPAVLIFTPILLPVATSIGVDPVHFGVIMVFNLSIGIITPPVGTLLFAGSSVADVPVERVIRCLVPYFIALFVILILVTYVPSISLALPKMFGLM